MDQFTFENQTLGSFLVYHMDMMEQVDHLALGMLTHNRIPGILPVVCTQMDTEKLVRFQISSLTALMGYWGGGIGRHKLLTFLSSFCKAVLECQEYMLDPGQILLNRDMVFVEPLSGEVRLAYLPVLTRQVRKETPEEFLRDLVLHTTFLPNEDSSYLPILLNTLNLPNFSIEALYKTVQSLMAAPQPQASEGGSGVKAVPQPKTVGNVPRKVVPASGAKPNVRTIQPAPGRRPVLAVPGSKRGSAPKPVQAVRPVQPADQSATVLLDGEPKNVPLSDKVQKKGQLCLVRRLTGEKVQINKPIFHVGRERRIVDFCLSGGHDWVGTDHAYFLCKPEGVFLVDNNSLNHTWVNGEKLASNQPFPVKSGDVIKMADEEFDLLPG